LTDAAVVGRILREYHQAGIEPSGIRRLAGSVRGARVSYWFGEPRDAGGPGEARDVGAPGGWPGPGGAGVVVRAFRTDVPLAGQFRGGRPAAVTDWLCSRAATLDWLQKHAYPAPRVIRTRSGDLVGLAGVWATLATTYVAGTPLRPGTGQLRLLGEALGRLHAMGAAAGMSHLAGEGLGRQDSLGEAGAGAAMGRAAWDPETAIPAALGRLEAVEDLAPADWRPLLDRFRAVLLAVRQRAPALPSSVVHGDPWPGNAVHVARDQVILIGWENSGLGLPLLDLGFCLLECHLDVGLPGNRPSAWHVRPDDRRIAAIAAGYSSWRQLQPAEKDLLPEGIRFPAAYVGAIDFEQALLTGVRGSSLDVRLELLRNRFAASGVVADLARRHFG
jgi:Ser/Thr protein kinase RdoA (MazF antagonist)